jgi:hypothetical protein
MLKYANVKRSSGLFLSKRDSVYLIRKNIKIKRSSLKLNYIKLKPFKIKEKKESVTFILDLLKDIKIHSTFYISLLKPVLKNVKLVILVLLNKDIIIIIIESITPMQVRLTILCGGH